MANKNFVENSISFNEYSGHIFLQKYIYIYIYIYMKERERERGERDLDLSEIDRIKIKNTCLALTHEK